MKLIKLTAIVFSSLILFQNTSQSQLKIVLGPAIGLTVPTGDYSGETTDYYNGTKYGLKPGINFGAMGKLYLGPINFNLSILYSPLRSDGQAATQSGSTVAIKHNLLMIGVGTQFGFGVPMAPVKPYVGFNLLFTSISGSTKFQGTQAITSNEIELTTASRTGLGFAAGVEIKLMSTLVDVSLRYNLLNLFSKSYDGSPTATTREDAYKYLNDAKDPNYNAGEFKHPIGTDRTISTLQFQLGVLFGL